MTMIRSLAIVIALCLFGTSASATKMQECRAKYKGAQTKSGAGLSWVDFQERKCGIKAKAMRRNQPLPRPLSTDVRPPQLAASFVYPEISN